MATEGATSIARWGIAPIRARRRGVTLEASGSARAAAVRRALRTGVVTLAAFAIGRWVIGSVTVAVFATFSALAITGIADYGGSRRGRAAAITGTVVLATGLTALGTWSSGQDAWAGCFVMFGVVAGIAVGGLLGGYAAAGSNALILFYVVAAGSAAPVAVIPDRIEGVALGGALALAAALALWPEPEHPQAMTRLGLAVGRLSARLSAAADGQPRASVEPDGPSLRATVDGLVDRPAAPTSAQRAELYLLNDLERLEGLTAALEAHPPSVADQPALARAAEALAKCARALALRRADAAPAAGGKPDAPAGSPFGLAARALAVTESVKAHTATALGARGPRFRAWADVVHGGRRFRANMTPQSVHVRDALRLGAGLALALAAVNVFALQHGFWVAFATLTVVKSNLRATERSVGGAIAGTLLGVVLAFALIAVLEPTIGWYLALLPLVVAAAIYANVAISFLAGQAGFTLAIVVLFNLLGPAGWRIGVVRLVDVAAGALVGLLIGALAWPRGASAVVGNAVADLVDRGASDLAATARHDTAGLALKGGRPTRQAAADASVRAESAFAQYLSEHPSPEAVSGWAHWLSIGNRLWYVADLVATTPLRRRGDWHVTASAASRLRAEYQRLASQLRGASTPPAARSAAPGMGDDLATWLNDLVSEAELASP